MDKEIMTHAIKRLRAHQVADQAMLFALMATHPDVGLLKRAFHHYSEQAQSILLNSSADQEQIDLLEKETAVFRATLESLLLRAPKNDHPPQR